MWGRYWAGSGGVGLGTGQVEGCMGPGNRQAGGVKWITGRQGGAKRITGRQGCVRLGNMQTRGVWGLGIHSRQRCRGLLGQATVYGTG